MEQLKSLYDKRIYELDTYKSILTKIIGIDYRYPNRKFKDTINSV